MFQYNSSDGGVCVTDWDGRNTSDKLLSLYIIRISTYGAHIIHIICIWCVRHSCCCSCLDQSRLSIYGPSYDCDGQQWVHKARPHYTPPHHQRQYNHSHHTHNLPICVHHDDPYSIHTHRQDNIEHFTCSKLVPPYSSKDCLHRRWVTQRSYCPCWMKVLDCLRRFS